MNVISESDFRDAIAGTKKDAKLVAAAKNDRTGTTETMHREFSKLPIDRQRDIITAISGDNFVGSQWKVGFPLNNIPAALNAVVIPAIGKVLFFAREEDAVKEAIRALKIYQQTPFLQTVAAGISDLAEIAGEQMSKILSIITSPDFFAVIRTLEPGESSEKLVRTILRIAGYIKDQKLTLQVAEFLKARKDSAQLPALAQLLENSIFMARDRRSVREILDGFRRGAIDIVLHRNADNRQVVQDISDLAWKTRDSDAIKNYLDAFLR